MGKTPDAQNQNPKQREVAGAVNAYANQPYLGLGAHMQVQTQIHAGPVAHPDLLKQYDVVVPGTAARMLDWAEAESTHRREMEKMTLQANAGAQQDHIELAKMQVESVKQSDRLGQWLGAAVSVMCIGGSFYLAYIGNDAGAAVLATLPLAAVIRAFFVRREPSTNSPKP